MKTDQPVVVSVHATGLLKIWTRALVGECFDMAIASPASR